MYTATTPPHTHCSNSLTATPYGAKQHQVSCLRCTMHRQVILPLFCFPPHCYPSITPLLFRLFQSRTCPSTSHCGQASSRHLRGQLCYLAAPLSLPKALLSVPPLLDWRGARQYLMEPLCSCVWVNGGALAGSPYSICGQAWLGSVKASTQTAGQQGRRR